MSGQDAFERIMASLYEAMLDDARWPAVSALIDEACGLTGNSLLVAADPRDDVRVFCVGTYRRGQRRDDLDREYLENHHPTDERVPRFRQLPDSRLTHIKDLYTAEELKTSPTYNGVLPRAGLQNSLNVRLDGSDGSHIAWSPNDPVDSDGWEAARPAGAGPRRSAEHDAEARRRASIPILVFNGVRVRPLSHGLHGIASLCGRN